MSGAGKDSGDKKVDKLRSLYCHLYARIFYVLLILIGMTIFLIFLILRPSKPSFTLKDLKLNTFNISTTSTLTSILQVTISSRNPNSRIAIYYDKFDVYATYRNEPITLPILIPPTYQGHKEVTVWSPFMSGSEVPMAPYLAKSLAEDEAAGMVLVNVKANGRVRWRVGEFVSRRYRLVVNCPGYITFGNKSNEADGGKYQFEEGCHVEV